jgi:hypothetical protein
MELFLIPAGFVLLIGLPAVYCRTQYRLVATGSGWFRTAAAIPLCFWLVWVVRFAVDLSHDATSHNLFPFEIAIYAATSLVYLGGLAALRRLLGAAA